MGGGVGGEQKKLNLQPVYKNLEKKFPYSCEVEVASFKHDLMIFASFEQASKHSCIPCLQKAILVHSSPIQTIDAII